MKVYVGPTGYPEATYELGKKGLLRWTNVTGSFHIMAMKDGGIGVYVPSSIKPQDVQFDAVIMPPTCPTCH